MDLLGNVLLSLKLRENSIGIFEFTAPWGFEMPALGPHLAFAFSAIDGPCWLSVVGGEPVCLQPGDSALMLGGVAHRYQSDPSAPLVSLPALWRERRLPQFGPDVHRTGPLRLRWAPERPGADAATTQLLTLAVVLQDATHHPLLSVLPPMIVLRESARRLFPWLPSALQFLAAEETGNTPGYTATASHLAELIITSFMRAHALTSPGDRPSRLRGLSDAGIGRALACLHARPGEAWTAQSLAFEAGMSRSTFARRFHARIGQPPIDYLIGWRMQRAADELVAGRGSVAEISRSLGYRSEWAFRQAFTRRFGLPPLRFAKQQRAARPEA